jgi:hypothetical protein
MISFNFDNEFIQSRLRKNLLEQIPVDFDQIHRYLTKSYLHLDASEQIRYIDLDGSYQLL